MYFDALLATQPSVKFLPVFFMNRLVVGKPVGFAPNSTTLFEFFSTNGVGTGASHEAGSPEQR
jgi:hypothetical protein